MNVSQQPLSGAVTSSSLSARRVSKDTADDAKTQALKLPLAVRYSVNPSVEPQIPWGRVKSPSCALSEFLTHKSAGIIKWLFCVTVLG